MAAGVGGGSGGRVGLRSLGGWITFYIWYMANPNGPFSALPGI